MQQQWFNTTYPVVPEIQQVQLSRKLYWLIISFSALRLIAAHTVELGNDEAYYWLYGQQLQWNYYDHPPMVAVWMRLFTFNLALEEFEVFVRLGSIVGCAVATVFMFKAVSLLHSPRAGWYAAVLFNTSYFSGMVAGLFIMPDSPQMLFWSFSLWMLARIMRKDNDATAWLLFGLSTGLCIMSKIHGAFLWIGTGIYVVFMQRSLLRRWYVYASLLITCIIVTPIFTWNFANDFATYRLHGNRVLVHEGTLNLQYFFKEVLGQLFFNNPVNVILSFAAIAVALRHRRMLKKLAIYILIGAPLALILLVVSLSKPVFPHWSGPGYVALIPVAAVYLASLNAHRAAARWMKASVTAFVIFLIGWIVVINYYPGTLGSKNHLALGKGDVTLDRYGWTEGADSFRVVYHDLLQQGHISTRTPVVCQKWWGAHVEYYFCRPLGLTMIGLGGLKPVGHYLWLNPERKKKVDMGTALCIIPSDELYDPLEYYSPYYNKISLVKSITISRGGAPARAFHIYRLTGWRSPANW